MKPIYLIKKLTAIGRVDFADADAVSRAVAAFLANLIEALTIELPKQCFDSEGPREGPRDHMFFYAGVIVGHGNEISEEKIREAHLAMMLPSNRAVISRLLYGPGLVTSLGVPQSYGDPA